MEDPSPTRARARASMAALAVAAALLGARATQLHLARRAPHAARPTAAVPARPVRGRILAAGGEVLADNVARWELDVLPNRLRARPGGVARLAALLGVSETSLDALFGGRGQRVVRVRRHLDDAVAEAVRGAARALPGVWLTPVEMRRYPQGAVTAAAVGGMRDVARDDAPGPYGYRLGDRIGHTGVERSWDLTLRGNSTLAPTHQGMTLVTHLDLRLQRAAWDALAEARGAAVALDPRDGRVLAYADRLAADPNAWERGAPAPVGEDRLARVSTSRVRDLLLPLLVTAARARGASLDALVPMAAPRDPARARCRERPRQRLDDLVAFGCVGATLPLFQPPWTDRAAALERVGFGRPSGVDLRDEGAGAVVRLADEGSLDLDRAYALATPLQVAVAYSAVVNGGTVYQPRIVHEVRHPDGALESRATPVVTDRVDLPSGESQRALASLARWVDARRDRPAYADLPPMGAFAQGDDWFVAVAPAAAPRVVVVAHTPRPRNCVAERPAPARGAEPAALRIARAWHRLSTESP